jgi:hypothetical protein
VGRNIFSIIPHGFGVEASFSVGQGVISWGQSKNTCETLHENAISRQFACTHDGIWASANPELDTTYTDNNSEIQKEAEEIKFQRMAKVHDFWRCGRAAKTYMLLQRKVVHNTSK